MQHVVDARPATRRNSAGGRSVALSEKDFQCQVTDLAVILGWEWLHFRPARTTAGWRTPVSGTVAAGWVDLVLCRPPRLILAELKSDKGKVSEHQERWLTMLGSCVGVECFLWRPADLEWITKVLA